MIHNHTNAEIVLYRSTLPMCDCRVPLWPTLPLKIIIIIKLQIFKLESA